MQTVIIIIGSIVLGFLLLSAYARVKMKNLPKVADHLNILTLTDKNFQQQTKNKVVLVDFWAEWCAPCKMMAPVLNDVANELTENAYVGKLNIEQYQSMAQQFNVRSIPTLIIFKNGKEVKRFVGIKQKDFLLKEINSVTI
ncbi:MAG: thioredoxin [Paludibacter sp.]|nr:thioredoxin [Paludibacter sp.]